VLKTVTFTYKDDITKKPHDGLIAQDVKKALDKLGLEFSGLVESENKEKILNLSYAEFVIPLINAVQEQQQQIESQQKENQLLKTELNSLKEEIGQIKALLGEKGSN